MGGGDVKVFERKLSKEEKKAAAKAKREAKQKASTTSKKSTSSTIATDDDGTDDDNSNNGDALLQAAVEARKIATQVVGDDNHETSVNGGTSNQNDGIDHEAADALAAAGTICTFASSRKGVDARNRDINGMFLLML
jgi:hypothetical protein